MWKVVVAWARRESREWQRCVSKWEISCTMVDGRMGGFTLNLGTVWEGYEM